MFKQVNNNYCKFCVVDCKQKEHHQTNNYQISAVLSCLAVFNLKGFSFIFHSLPCSLAGETIIAIVKNCVYDIE